MIPIVTNESALVDLDGEVRADTIQLEVVDTVYLAGMAQDSGNGIRPLSPLILSVGGSGIELPLTLQRGFHVISLVGEEFDGRSLLLTGLQMFNIREIVLGIGGVASPASGAEAVNESVVGPVNGANASFLTSSRFVPGTTRLFVNTVRQVLNVDYIELGEQTLQLNPAPAIGDTIRIDYTRS
jgi:hypothetical protein